MEKEVFVVDVDIPKVKQLEDVVDVVN